MTIPAAAIQGQHYGNIIICDGDRFREVACVVGGPVAHPYVYSLQETFGCILMDLYFFCYLSANGNTRPSECFIRPRDQVKQGGKCVAPANITPEGFIQQYAIYQFSGIHQ